MPGRGGAIRGLVNWQTCNWSGLPLKLSQWRGQTPDGPGRSDLP